MLESFVNLSRGDAGTWSKAVTEARTQFLDPQNNHKLENVKQYLEILNDIVHSQTTKNELRRVAKKEFNIISIVGMACEPATEDLLQLNINTIFRSYFEDGSIEVQAIIDFSSFLVEAISLVPQDSIHRSLLEGWNNGLLFQEKALTGSQFSSMTNQSKRPPPAD
jgi:hypothetical protein